MIKTTLYCDCCHKPIISNYDNTNIDFTKLGEDDFTHQIMCFSQAFESVTFNHLCDTCYTETLRFIKQRAKSFTL